ncbi:hypothetical protein [Helicobacter sp. 11S03491-1]|uniref:hypothetical protein n=1 Tax=Helicobacter sp. 11S03491-1 TaxID=1476196 RepID=UPI000BA7BF09|nr:hypothetical protein [Helicobacter sp. 11S03491-1]PAF43786.1 hypothetical protein BKH45_00525 [Helicobacter sp. 11S03491-1]
MENLAPVMIMVYDRLDCLKNAIESLAKNSLARHTDVFIVSDAPYKLEHQKAIKEVRDYINTLSHTSLFKSVEGIFWQSNKGSFNSGKEATDYIFSKYERLISFEDDILVSNKFLEYMNQALELYKDNQEIISITSSVHYDNKKIIPKNYPYDVFLLKMFSPWGTGMWKDRYESIDWELKGVEEFIKDKKQIKAFNAISTHMLPILKDTLENNKKHADVMICFNMFKTNRYTLYPIKPLSVNVGHDGRGEHCGVNPFWQNQELIPDFCPKLIKNILYSKTLAKNYQKAFYSYRADLIIPFLKSIGLYKIFLPIYKKLKTKKG